MSFDPRTGESILKTALAATLSLCLLLGCSSNASAPIKDSSANGVLPESLSRGDLTLQAILEQKDSLSQPQLALVLRNYLKQWNNPEGDKRQASYLLGRALQSSTDTADLKEALHAYQDAEPLAPLQELARWHIVEIGATIGQEKTVRATLNALIQSTQSKEVLARANYGMAQSLMRANETEKAKEAFEQVRKQFPGSSYSIGSNYYLGEIAWAKATNSTPPPSGQPVSDSQGKTNTVSDAGGANSGASALDTAGSTTSAVTTTTVTTTATTTAATTGTTTNTTSTVTTTTATPANARPAFVIVDSEAMHNALELFTNYLSMSPQGHFSSQVLSKFQKIAITNPSLLTPAAQNAMALAYYESGQWDKALSIWSKNVQSTNLLRMASCQAHLKNSAAARNLLLEALKSGTAETLYLPVAKMICAPLSRDESTALWKQILALVHRKDEALYNLAIRSTPPTNLSYFAQLAKNYPNSVYAGESNWWLFWDGVQHKKGKDLEALADKALTLAQTHKLSRTVPRFLFWRGKIYERLGKTEQAIAAYKQVAPHFQADYYAFRALDRIYALNKMDPAGHFYRWNVPVVQAIPANWDWPDDPEPEMRDEFSGITLKELIKIKDYDEAFNFLADHDYQTKAWLFARMNYALQAIMAASTNISERPRTSEIWRFAYPLLYTADVQQNCRRFGVDPFLMHSLIREESHYDAHALSPSRAIGLTQLMPGTAAGGAKLLHIEVKDLKDYFQPAINIQLGTQYLATCLSRFNGNQMLAVASYNGGGGAVKSWMSKEGMDDPDRFVENIPYRETRDYVRKVFSSYWNYMRTYKVQQ
jgi:soluble lytic murein transglycosylase-like protein